MAYVKMVNEETIILNLFTATTKCPALRCHEKYCKSISNVGGISFPLIYQWDVVRLLNSIMHILKSFF